MACTRRCALIAEDRRRFLECYFGKDFRQAWWLVSEFWNLKPWRRLRGKKDFLDINAYPVRPPFVVATRS